MHVIEVIPLTRGSQIESLSYYSATDFPVGSIIDVPIRKQEKRALVTNSAPVSKTKTAVKSATFSLRKLPAQSSIGTLPPALIETAKQLTKTTPSSLGAALYALLPPEVREGEVVLENNLPCIGTYETPAVSVLQGTHDERLRTYRSYIRTAFAHRGTILLVVPTASLVNQLAESLSSGIENRVVTFSSTYTKKRLAKSYAELADLSHAKLVITTPTYCCVDRHDITNIIIEQSSSSYFKSKTRPYFDTRDVLITLARMTGRQVLMGDLLPRTEEEQKRRDDFYNTEGETPKRLTLPSKLTRIEQKTERSASDHWRLLSPELVNILSAAHSQKQHSLVLAARRGMAPVVSCVDCGHIFRCPNSGEPYSLHKTGSGETETRWFIAHSSGRRIKALDTCPDCGSWRLKERGVGIQQIQSALAKDLPQVPVLLFDQTSASTPRKAQKIISDFYDQKGALLLATPMVLSHLEKSVHTIAITSEDATRSIPTWRAEETYLGLLLRLRELATEQVVIQARNEADEIISIASQGLVEQFYDSELELREQLQYPPYTHFIHITIQGSKPDVTELEEAISAVLKDYTLRWYSAPQFIEAGVRRYGLLRVSKSNWPDPELMQLLRSLPPMVRIEVNPERII